MKQHHNSRNSYPPRHHKSREQPRTYEAFDLKTMPLNPKRCGEVLRLIVQEHN